MQTLTLTRVFRKQKVGKSGREFTSLGLQCSEYPGKWINGFGSTTNANWKAGDKVEVEIKEEGVYLNFEMPKGSKGDRLNDDRLTRIEQKLDRLLAKLGVTPTPTPTDSGFDEPKPSPNPQDDDVPF